MSNVLFHHLFMCQNKPHHIHKSWSLSGEKFKSWVAMEMEMRMGMVGLQAHPLSVGRTRRRTYVPAGAPECTLTQVGNFTQKSHTMARNMTDMKMFIPQIINPDIHTYRQKDRKTDRQTDRQRQGFLLVQVTHMILGSWQTFSYTQHSTCCTQKSFHLGLLW